ncbi:hypothetical protein [Zobellia laminariae]|uniref:hypothetical protein n=1 Tax=Zobellia laminariae TaxID=248906 RepID=UPI0026F463BD|nr:hypothetical protein [Zobellia laminariae]WKX76198.1 hypothetical protein Q5W13_21945 [Zobellia laminariae]
MSDIYNRIGQRIVNSIDEDWNSATLNLEYIGAVKSTLEYIDNKEEEKSTKLSDSFQNMRDIKELHKITTEGGNNKWNKALFSMKPDGDFDMEFIWDQELQDEVESFS